jgi:hypothetical protein
MNNGDGPGLTERIARRGREVVVERLRTAFAHQAAAHDERDLDPERLERMVQEAAARAGEALWRRSLAQAAMEELGISLAEALAHPVVADAQNLVDTGGDRQELVDTGGDAPLPASETLPPTPELAEEEPHHLDLGSDPDHPQPWPSDRQAPSGESFPMVAGAQARRPGAGEHRGPEPR